MTRLLLVLSLSAALLLPASAAAAPSADVTLELAAGKSVALPHTGTLQISGVRVRSLLARLTPRAAVSAVVRGRRVTVAQGTGPITASTASRRLSFTAAGARALRRPLLRGRTLGTLRGGPGPLPRPAGAVDLASATISWHVRDSFVQYMAAGEGTTASGGATAAPPTVGSGSSTPLVYDFGFAFRDGWADAKSGKAAARFRGTVRFGYKAHGIALRASDPEIEIDGARSRAIFRVGSGAAASRRAVLVDLDLAKAKVVGDTREIPGTIPASATSSVFAGYYLPHDPFGWITLRLGS